jgi:hypothetical protein
MTSQAARKAGRKEMPKTAYSNFLRLAAVAMAMLAVVLVALAVAKPAEETLTQSSKGHPR